MEARLEDSVDETKTWLLDATDDDARTEDTTGLLLTDEASELVISAVEEATVWLVAGSEEETTMEDTKDETGADVDSNIELLRTDDDTRDRT